MSASAGDSRPAADRNAASSEAGANPQPHLKRTERKDGSETPPTETPMQLEGLGEILVAETDLGMPVLTAEAVRKVVERTR